jgi:hypothetical protein
LIFRFFFFFGMGVGVLVNESRALHILGKHSTTEQHLQPFLLDF